MADTKPTPVPPSQPPAPATADADAGAFATPPADAFAPPPPEADAATDPGSMLEAMRLAIFRGLVDFKDHELDADSVYMTSRGTHDGLDVRRVVNKTTRRAGYAIVREGRMVAHFPVADTSGVFLTRETSRPALWMSDRLDIEGALVARAERDRAKAAEPQPVTL